MFVETGVCGFALRQERHVHITSLPISDVLETNANWNSWRSSKRPRRSIYKYGTPAGGSTNKNLKGRTYFINSSAASVAP
jgi:hypothetical protein